jgi:hypothetical protein
MNTEASYTEECPQEEATPGKTGRPPPMVITAAVNTTTKTVPTMNFFAPIRTASMDTEDSNMEESPQEEATPGMKKLNKSVVKKNFEYRNTRNGTRVITKTLGDFAAVKSYLETYNLHYFTFYPKSLKPIKVVIRHLPLNTPAQDISDGRMDLVLISSVSSKCQPPVGHRLREPYPKMSPYSSLFCRERQNPKRSSA